MDCFTASGIAHYQIIGFQETGCIVCDLKIEAHLQDVIQTPVNVPIVKSILLFKLLSCLKLVPNKKKASIARKCKIMI